MPEYLSPGVYIEELPGPQSIQGVGTSTTGMVGVTKKGPTEGRPRLVTSYAEFITQFGGPYRVGPGTDDVTAARVADWVFGTGKGGRWWLVPYAVQGFFDNGGQRLFFKRVTAASAVPASSGLAPVGIGAVDEEGNFQTTDPVPTPPAADAMSLRISASSAGQWGNGMNVRVVPSLGRRLTIDGPSTTSQTTARVEKGATEIPLDQPPAGPVVAKIGNELVRATPGADRIMLDGGIRLGRAYDSGTVVELRTLTTLAAAPFELNIRGFGASLPGMSAAKPVYDDALLLLRPAVMQLSELTDDNRFLVGGWDDALGVVTLKERAPGAPMPATLDVFAGDELIVVEPRIEIEYTDLETGTPQCTGRIRIVAVEEYLRYLLN